MGNIIIKGLRVFAYHGVNPEEKEYGQVFEIDITAGLDMNKACISDRIEDTVSYSSVVKTVKRIMTAGSDNLLERAAYRIAEGILFEYRQINEVSVTLKKPDAPIKADFDYVGVSLSFTRKDIFDDEDEAEAEEDNNDESEIPYNEPVEPEQEVTFNGAGDVPFFTYR